MGRLSEKVAIITGGGGGMGGAQPLAVTMNGAAFLGVDVDETRIRRRVETGYCDRISLDLDEALAAETRHRADLATLPKRRQPLHLFLQFGDLVIQLFDLGLPRQRGFLPIGAVQLSKITRDAVLNLRDTAL